MDKYIAIGVDDFGMVINLPLLISTDSKGISCIRVDNNNAEVFTGNWKKVYARGYGLAGNGKVYLADRLWLEQGEADRFIQACSGNSEVPKWFYTDDSLVCESEEDAV